MNGIRKAEERRRGGGGGALQAAAAALDMAAAVRARHGAGSCGGRWAWEQRVRPTAGGGERASMVRCANDARTTHGAGAGWGVEELDAEEKGGGGGGGRRRLPT